MATPLVQAQSRVAAPSKKRATTSQRPTKPVSTQKSGKGHKTTASQDSGHHLSEGDEDPVSLTFLQYW